MAEDNRDMSLDEIRKQLSEANSELKKSVSKQERVAVAAEISFKVTQNNMKVMFDDFKQHMRRQGKAVSETVAQFPREIEGIVSEMQEGDRLSIITAQERLEGFKKAAMALEKEEREFVFRSLHVAQQQVDSVARELPTLMGQIVYEAIDIPLGAIESFMESNFFTRILFRAFKAHRQREKVRKKEEQLRLEQIRSDKIQKVEEREEAKKFYQDTFQVLNKEITLAIASIRSDRDLTDDEKDSQIASLEGAREDAKIQTAKEAASRFEMVEPGEIYAPAAPKSDREKTAESILSMLGQNNETLNAILTDGLGASSPGWLEKLPELLRISEKTEKNTEDTADATEQNAKQTGVMGEMRKRMAERATGLAKGVKGMFGFGKKGADGEAGADGAAGKDAGIIGSMGSSISGVVESLAKFPGNLLASLAKGVRIFFKSLAKGLKELADPRVIQGAIALLTISASLIVFAGAMVLFTMVSWGKAIIGILAFLTFATIMGFAANMLAPFLPLLPALGAALMSIIVPLLVFAAAALVISVAFSIFTDALVKWMDPKVLLGVFSLMAVLGFLTLAAPSLFISSLLLAASAPGLLIFGGAMHLLASALVAFSAVTGQVIAQMFFTLSILSMMAPLLVGASILLGIAAPGFLFFGAAMLVFANGVAQFVKVTGQAIAAMVFSLLSLVMIAPLLITTSLSLLLAAPGFLAFGTAMLVFANGVAEFVKVTGQSIAGMVFSLLSLVLIAPLLVSTSILLLLAAPGFLVFGAALIVFGLGVQQFVNTTLSSVFAMATALFLIAALAPLLYFVSGALMMAAPGFAAFGLAMAVASAGIFLFGNALQALAAGVAAFGEVGITAVITMLFTLTALAPIATIIGVLSPIIALAGLALAFFGEGLMTLARPLKVFGEIGMEGAFAFLAVMGAIATIVPVIGLLIFPILLATVAIHALSGALMSLAVAGLLLAVFAEPLVVVLTLITFIGLISPLLTLAAVALFGIAAGLVAFGIAAIIVTALLPFFLVTAFAITAVAISIAILAKAGMMLAQVFVPIILVMNKLIQLALMSPLLILAAVGIFMISASLITFGLANIAAAAMMAASAVGGFFASLFGGEEATPLGMLAAIATMAPMLFLAGKGIQMIAEGIQTLASALGELDPDQLGVLDKLSEVGGTMSFSRQTDTQINRAENVRMRRFAGGGAEAMALNAATTTSMERTQAVQMNVAMAAQSSSGGGGGAAAAPVQDQGGKRSSDGSDGGGIMEVLRMNESTFRRVQERFYKSAIV
mgnify:CR=1 FL=1